MAKKKQKRKTTQTASPAQPPPKRQVANFPSLIEILHTPQGLRFFMAGGTCEDQISYAGEIYIPTKSLLFPIPNEKVLDHVNNDDEALFDDVHRFIFEHLDCPDERHYGILTAFTLHTHQIEKAEASPIMRFYGPKGSGKSRGGDVLSLLARRGISTANLTGPGLFRVNEVYSPTFIIDEIQIYGKMGDKDLKDMLNVRYRRGSRIIRINRDKSGPESIETFDAFGPTVLCGTEELPDTVKSRAITFFMEPHLRAVNRHIDYERASDLRNRLTAFRFRHFKTTLSEPERAVSNGRLDEVLFPLHQIIRLVRPSFEADFVAFAKSLEADRIEEDYESFDAEVCRALIDCKAKVVSGKISVQDITSVLNAARVSHPIAERAVGSVLNRLGLKPCRFSGSERWKGRYARSWDDERIMRLAKKFDIAYP